MSNPIPPIAAPTGEFQGQINGPPNTSDPAASCKQCAGLLAERQKLREELAKVQKERDDHLKVVYYFLRKEYAPPDFTREEVLAHVDDEPTIHDLIAELEGAEKPA